jgi:hypothetical protein
MVHILAGATNEFDSVLKAAQSDRTVDWIVPKKSRINDPALFHLPPHGFAARGVIASEPHQNKPGQYTAEVGEVVFLASFVPLAFVRKNHPSWKWPTYPRSYATIEGDIESRLEKLLNEYQASFAEPIIEGTPKTVSITLYERNPLARQQCIAHYGTDCHACGFSFGATYGETADGYIHVHHLNPLSSTRGEGAVDPIKDLRPICPNCHAVAHLQNLPLSIAELKRILNEARSPA